MNRKKRVAYKRGAGEKKKKKGPDYTNSNYEKGRLLPTPFKNAAKMTLQGEAKKPIGQRNGG